MARLHVFPTEAALEVGLEEFLRARNGVVATLEVGRGLTSIPRLLREAIAPGPRDLGRLAEDLLIRAACADGWGDGPMPSSFAPRLAVALASLRRSGIAPSALRAVAPSLPPAARHDTQRFAGALARYEELLGERIDEADTVRRALHAMAHEPLPSLADVTEVELHDAAPIDPLARAVIEALARRGLTVRCRIPDPPVPQASGAGARYDEGLAAAVTLALDGLEAIGLDHVERRRGSLGSGPLPEVIVLPTPELEAQAIARWARDEIAAGAAPDEIAIVAGSSEQRAALVSALLRYDVPAEPQLGDPLAESGYAGLLRTVLTLANERTSRDGLAALLSSRYLAPPRTAEGEPIERGRIGAALRAALPTSVRTSDWRPNLQRWVATRPPSRRGEAEAVVRHVLRARDLLESLPERATLEAHVTALRSVLAGLGMAVVPLERAADASAARSTAWAADQASERAVLDWLDELPRAARRAGLDERKWARDQVADLLGDRLAGARIPLPAGRGAGVVVCGIDRLPVRALRLLVLSGMDEHALERSNDDPLIHEETRRTLGRALGRMVFSVPGQEEARDRIRLAQVRSHASRVLLTLARVDGLGRAVVPGELVTHARALGASESRPLSDLVPRCEDARSVPELVARLLLEEGGDQTSRQGLTEASRGELRARLASHAPTLLEHASLLADVERSRDRFFAGERTAGAYDGRVTDPAVLARLVERALPGTANRPLSASTFMHHPQCPARIILESVVRVRPGEELEDELDERASGTLAHLVLERLFTGWRDAGCLPLSGRPEEASIIDEALERAIEQFAREQPLGNPVLFAVRRRALRRLMEAVWRRELEAPAVVGLVPTAFELRFDALPVPGGPPDRPPAFLRGSIDRVDRSVDGRRAAVFDYKSGRLSSLTAELKTEALGDTSWQLPLYAAVVREQWGVDDVEMVYYALRDLRWKSVPAPDWLRLRSDQPVSAPLLSGLIWQRVGAMRAGHFEVAPRPKACERCRLQPVCRVAERRGDEQLGEPEAET